MTFKSCMCARRARIVIASTSRLNQVLVHFQASAGRKSLHRGPFRARCSRETRPRILSPLLGGLRANVAPWVEAVTKQKTKPTRTPADYTLRRKAPSLCRKQVGVFQPLSLEHLLSPPMSKFAASRLSRTDLRSLILLIS